MDVSVETTGGLGRRLKFTVPATEVDELVEARLRKMSKSARLDGFRPGKVPLKVIQARFGRRVFDEVASEVMESSYRRAVAEHGLTPVGNPDFKNTDALPGQVLQFTADIELYPEFKPASLAQVKIDKPVAEVCAADVDDMVERLRLQHAEWRAVRRPVGGGDRVRVHFEEKVEAFNADDNGDLTLTVGAPGIPGEFAAQLLKAGPGAVKKIKLKFPADYPRAELAGEKLKFKVTVREVEESVLPALDQDFFDKCDVKKGGLEALKAMLKEGMEHELQRKLQSSFENNVVNVLLATHDVEAPQVMIRREIERMRNDAAARLGIKENAGQLEDDLFTERAARRVKLGLIMNKLAEHNRLDVSEQEFEAGLDKMVAAYEDTDAAKHHYRHDRRARSALAGLVLESKIFQWVIEQGQVEEKPCSFKEIMQSKPV